jgi:hypothetical protein
VNNGRDDPPLEGARRPGCRPIGAQPGRFGSTNPQLSTNWSIARRQAGPLVVGADSAVRAQPGHTLSMTVDGVSTPIVAGHSYTGNIVVSVGRAAPHATCLGE